MEASQGGVTLVHVGIDGEVLMHSSPDASIAPSGKAFEDAVPLAVAFWQVAPGGTCMGYPVHAFQEALALPGIAHVGMRVRVQKG